MKLNNIKLFENFDEEDNSIYFYIEDGDKKSIINLYKSDGKWRESLVRGDEPYGLGGKTYQSYLRSSDLLQWLNKDYDHVEIVDVDDMDNYIEENIK